MAMRMVRTYDEEVESVKILGDYQRVIDLIVSAKNLWAEDKKRLLRRLELRRAVYWQDIPPTVGYVATDLIREIRPGNMVTILVPVSDGQGYEPRTGEAKAVCDSDLTVELEMAGDGSRQVATTGNILSVGRYKVRV